MLFNNKTATSSIKITPIPSNSKLFLYFFHANLILFFFLFSLDPRVPRWGDRWFLKMELTVTLTR